MFGQKQKTKFEQLDISLRLCQGNMVFSKRINLKKIILSSKRLVNNIATMKNLPEIVCMSLRAKQHFYFSDKRTLSLYVFAKQDPKNIAKGKVQPFQNNVLVFLDTERDGSVRSIYQSGTIKGKAKSHRKLKQEQIYETELPMYQNFNTYVH